MKVPMIKQVVVMVELHEHPALLQAFREYQQARKMVKAGLLGNAGHAREYLRAVYQALKRQGVPS